MFRPRCRPFFAIAALVAATLACVERAHAAADAKTLVKCQATLKKQGAKLVTKKLGGLAKCADGVAKCIQTIADEAKRTACVTKAREGCLKALAAMTAARASYVAAIGGACGALDPAQVTGAGGLGFAGIDCSAFAGPVTGAGDLGACLAAQHDCLASRLFQLAVPRARELLDFTPPPAAVVPPADLAVLACLDTHGGAGADVDDVALGKSLMKCQKTIIKAATKLASGPLKTLEKCVDALFNCDRTKTGAALGKCRDKARAACAKGLDKQAAQSAALAASFGQACGDPAVFAALRSAAGGNLDAAACASVATVADYQACVRAESERLVHELVRFQAPTADTLLAAVGCDLERCGPAPTATPTAGGPTSTSGGTPTPQPTVTPGGTCPTTYQLTFDGDAADEDLGYSGAYHDEPLPTNVRLTLGISDCDNPLTPCGECALSGPLPNTGAAFANRRCRGTNTDQAGSWVPCTSDGDCPGTGNACVFFAGPPQGLIGVPLCLVTEIAAPIAGTVDLDTGDTALDLPVRVRTFAAESSFHPCPRCLAGSCSSGPRAGQACTVQGRSTFAGDDVSLDCPPAATGSTIGVRQYTMPLSTGESSVTLDAASPDCGSEPGKKCFCQTCSDAARTPCFSNADCAGGATCGGRRCLSGPNVGAPCTLTSQCPSSLCDVPGEDTRPNGCTDHVCTPNPADTQSVNEGICLAGPSYKACAIEKLRGCNTDADCTFAGDSCITYTYNCFTDNGAIDGTVSVSGSPSTTDPTFGGLFCMPPTDSLAVNLLIGLPGLGRATLPAAVALQ